MVSARLASPEYLAAQTVSVTLAKNDGGAYGFAGTSLSDVDALIVSYPAYMSKKSSYHFRYEDFSF